MTMSSKAVFITTGLGVQVALPHLLDAEQFGRYSTVAAVTAIITNTLVAATIQTVSRRVVGDESRADHAQREGLVMGAVLAACLGGGFAMVSPWLAERWQGDASLTPLFVCAAVVMASYALYAAQIGAVNGRRRFAQQARFDMGFALLRPIGIVVGAALGAAGGALLGFALAAVVICAVAFGILGAGRGTSAVDRRAWLRFFLPVAVYHACLNAILQIDQPLLRATVADLAAASGQVAAEATALASRTAGFYRAAQTFAFVPYQLIVAVTFVVFPTVARATHEGDADALRRAVRGAMRFSLLVLLAMAAPIAGASDGVMRIAYPEEYLAGAPALGVLALGLVPFSMFAIGAAVLAGAGRERAAAGLSAFALLLVVAGNLLAVRAVGLGASSIVAAAIATSVGATVALVGTVAVLRALVGSVMPWGSVARAGVSACIGWAVAHVVPHDSRIQALVACAVGCAAYLGGLVLLREVGAREFELMRRVLSARRPR